MIQVFELSPVNGSATIASNTVIKLYVDKLNELGLCGQYDSGIITVSGNATTAAVPVAFPDGKTVELQFSAYTASISGVHNANARRFLFVDKEKHMIAGVTEVIALSNTAQIINEIDCLCADDYYGNLVQFIQIGRTSGYGYAYQAFNIANTVWTLEIDKNFAMYPLYMALENAFPRNFYFAPKKCHSQCEVLTDTSGNEFISILPHFYYKLT